MVSGERSKETTMSTELIGRRVAILAYPSFRTDLANAGANVVDEEVATDNGLVSSRSPYVLDAFCAKIVEEFAEGKHPVGAAQ